VTALIGYWGLLLALASAMTLAVQGVRVARNPALGRGVLKYPTLGLIAGAVVAMLALEVALVRHDFSIEYIAENNARATPLLFTIASAWAALEGSIVLWGLVLAGYTGWVFWRLREGDRLGAGALAVMALVAIFFFGLMVTISNPFATLEFVPADGNGPNALLQNNILMAVHPPLLYLGFVGFTVPFAFAISALALGVRGSVWLERTHSSTLVAWGFLTLGIVMGGLWSYVVLGWGGYWAWDPVENASFIPWIVATAFIHSAVVQRRRGMLQSWNLALVIGTFSLTILGTFLTRSGIIASVHSFTQSAIGPALLAFLAVVLAGSFGLFALRVHLVASPPRLESLASREGVFLFNNLVLTLFAFVVLIGTLYPMILEAFTSDQVSVGRPFFDRAAVPVGFALLFAVGIGPVTPYRIARAGVVWERIRGPIQIALVTTALVVVAGGRTWTVVLVVLLATFVVAVIGRHLWVTASKRRETDGNMAAAMLGVMRRDPHYWGGQISHIGVALLAVGITVSSSFALREAVTLESGDSVEFAGYTVTYAGPFSESQPHRDIVGAVVELSRGGTIDTLRPRLNQYPNQVQAVATPAVKAGLRDDIYVALTRFEPTVISIDLFRYPLIWLVWVGGIVAAGGVAWGLAVRKPAREVELVATGAGDG
jgi:cytochrome c-type biogenesis protein CcmF